MMRWIHDKGLSEVFDFIEEHFEETWTMSIEELITEKEHTRHDRRR
ncbi:hypothetical protein MKA38_09140 [[Clostridium] innocuum]|nr:hypothetical protein [[Clostridium] innocuum]